MAEDEEGWFIAEVVIGGSKYCDSMVSMITGGRMDGWMRVLRIRVWVQVRSYGDTGIRGIRGSKDWQALGLGLSTDHFRRHT